jgi:hypothetical protein
VTKADRKIESRDSLKTREKNRKTTGKKIKITYGKIVVFVAFV